MTATLPHGRRKYIEEGHRCDTCRGAATRYNNWLRHQNAYGLYRTVDAQPVRDHVNQLRAAGMGIRRIAAVAGVAEPVISKLLYGIPSQNRAPSARLYTSTAQKILAVTPDLADGARINSLPARRRIQALVAIRWSMSKLAGRLGVLPGNLAGRVAYGASITVRNDRAIRELYEELWDTLPGETQLYDRISAIKSRNLAKQRGWPPPMWWDDERLDDPTPTVAERPAVVRRMAAQGATLRGIMLAIRADRQTVQKLLEAS